MQERGGINEISSQKILSAKIAAYNEALKEYELSLKLNYVQRYMMGLKDGLLIEISPCNMNIKNTKVNCLFTAGHP